MHTSVCSCTIVRMEITKENRTWRVVRVSTTTGRVLKELFQADTFEQAKEWAAGFGRDPSPQTSIQVQRRT